MYIDMSKLEYHINPEGKGFLAYADLGKDENGKRIRPKVRGRTEDEATEKLKRKLRDMGYTAPTEGTPKLDIIINEFTSIPDFVREYRVNSIVEQIGQPNKSSRTGENYIFMLKPFEKYFQQATVGDITTRTLNQFFRAMENTKCKTGDFYSQTSLNRIKLAVHMMFKRAKNKGWISLDPFASDDFKPLVSKKTTEDIEGLTPENVVELIGAIKSNIVIYTPIMLMLNTGMRTQEALALRWGDIDFENNIIHIQQAVTVEVEFDDDGNIKGRKSIIGSTKTKGSNRYIGLPVEVKELLLKWREEAPKITKTKTGEENFVFGYERRENFTYDAFRNKISSYLTRQKSEASELDNFRLHRLRHTVITLLAAEGREIIQIMKQTGINQEKTLLRYIDKKGNKKIIDGNVQAISKGLADMMAGGKVNNSDKEILQGILTEANKLEDSSIKAVLIALFTAMQGV